MVKVGQHFREKVPFHIYTKQRNRVVIVSTFDNWIRFEYTDDQYKIYAPGAWFEYSTQLFLQVYELDKAYEVLYGEADIN